MDLITIVTLLQVVVISLFWLEFKKNTGESHKLVL